MARGRCKLAFGLCFWLWSEMSEFLQRVWRPMHGPRVDLLVRGEALAVVLFAWKAYASSGEGKMWAVGSFWLHALCAVSVGVLLFGARPALLVASSLLACACMVANHWSPDSLLWFPAAEWPLFVILPLATWWCGREGDAITAFRLGGATAMGFAGFHKLNSDFFDPVVTCNRLAYRLTEWWGIPEGVYAWVTPTVVVSMELSLPLLLWFRPRLGVLAGCLLLAQFVGIGASALSMVVGVCVLSFLNADDHAALRAWSWRFGVAAIPGALLSYGLYLGPWSWPQYGFCHGILGAVAMFLVLRMERLGWGDAATLFRGRSYRVAVLALFWWFNGMAPYTGLKFQYSFAMLSNLRVDAVRHNSLVVPKALRFSAHDPYVHVRHAEYRRSGKRLRDGFVQPGLYTPFELEKQARIASEVGEELVVLGTYRGEPVDLARARALPSAHLFQKRLALEGPQPCVH